MIQKKIKNLIFDFGGVLIDLDRQRCIERFRQLGLADVENMLGLYAQQDFFRKHEKGLITDAEFRDTIRTLSGRQLTDARIDDAWNSFLVGISPSKLDMLLHLRKDYVIYLLSNTNHIHWQWACENAFPYKSFRVEDYFEQIFLSYEMKMAKPSPEIFQAVLSETGIEPSETLFIDDSADNCRAAAALGIDTYNAKPHEDWSRLFG